MEASLTLQCKNRHHSKHQKIWFVTSGRVIQHDVHSMKDNETALLLAAAEYHLIRTMNKKGRINGSINLCYLRVAEVAQRKQRCAACETIVIR